MPWTRPAALTALMCQDAPFQVSRTSGPRPNGLHLLCYCASLSLSSVAAVALARLTFQSRRVVCELRNHICHPSDSVAGPPRLEFCNLHPSHFDDCTHSIHGLCVSTNPARKRHQPHRLQSLSRRCVAFRDNRGQRQPVSFFFSLKRVTVY